MAIPYTPSQLVLGNFDATQAAIATWLFSSSDTTVVQKSFDVQIYNNATNALVFDTGTITSANAQYTIPANTLTNRTVYKWRVQYTDSSNNVSAWSAYQVFTCSSAPVATVTSPTASQTITSNVFTVTASYQQSQTVAESSYRIIVYENDQVTITQDSGTVYNTANQLSIAGLANGTYFAQVVMTSADGLQTTSGKVQFTVNFNGLAASLGISANPLPQQAAIELSWYTPKSIPGTYAGPGATYMTGKFSQAIRVAALGEKVYWTVAPFNQFLYTSWFIPNLASSAMKNNQVFAHIQADANNYVQIRYDHVGQTFVMDYCVAGRVLTTVSASGLTFSSGAQIFLAIRQTSTLDAFIGLNNSWYKFSVASDPTDNTNTLGVGVFGTATFANPVAVKSMSYTTAYIGCTPQDGNEANALFDQTHLTSQTLSDTQIQTLYTNATLQTFGIQSMFLANFDGTLEGGTATPVPIDHWNVYRLYNGAQKQLATITNTGQTNATYTDSTPFANVTYQYNVVSVDASGNVGTPQSIQASVSFDGWWLMDTATNTAFQFLISVDDVPIKTNYARQEYVTFGILPVTAYSPTRYRTGKLSGLVIGGYNGASSAFAQYQTLQAMIDKHIPLLLRGDEGWALMVDCYDPTNTIPKRNHKEYNKIELAWTEVGVAS